MSHAAVRGFCIGGVWEAPLPIPPASAPSPLPAASPPLPSLPAPASAPSLFVYSTPARPMDLALQQAITIDWASRGVGDEGCHEIERAWDRGGGLRQVVRMSLRACKVGDVGMCVLARIAAQGERASLARSPPSGLANLLPPFPTSLRYRV